MSKRKNAVNAAKPTVRDTGTATCPIEAGEAARHSHRPAMPPNRMAPIWATEEVLNRIMSAATTAIDARSRSGHSVRAMPHTACPTIATATSLRP